MGGGGKDAATRPTVHSANSVTMNYVAQATVALRVTHPGVEEPPGWVAPGASNSGQPSAPRPGGEAGRRVDRAAGRGPQETCHPVPFCPILKGKLRLEEGN